ncbi:S-layer homology domain-containing protein [Bacillus infantis]|uniref:S-layer homology domain-containing protein n=1 Tax=Bacillus infantis TaxID=324767 RepID=UPI001CD783A7|nr:S-layer homology domain-containing protein [Bacillus infantis]MCA1041629.1 S-layer homology domain-containing protein [Bacillus infantis]
MAYQSKNHRKFLATSLTAAMVASAVAPAVSAASFPDVKDDNFYAPYVNQLADAGIIEGMPNGTFGLRAKVTRAEAAKMVSIIRGLDTSAAPASFEDVKQGAWYSGYINALYAAKLIDGINEKEFAPNGTLTRAQFAKLVVEAYDLDLQPTAKTPFTDVKEGVWYTDYVKTLYANGLINGKTATTFEPNSTIDRADFAKLLVDADLKFGFTLGKASVTGVSASDLTTLNVTLKGKVKDGATVTAEDFELKINDAKANFTLEKVSDTQYKLNLTSPLSTGDKVVVTGLSDLAGSATYTYSPLAIKEVKAVETAVFGGYAGQFLGINVDGKDMTAAELVAQGYSVVFQADEAVFKDGNGTSTTSITGELTSSIDEDDDFSYKVSVSKGNDVLVSGWADVTVYDKSKTAFSSIDSVSLNVVDGATEVINTLTSNKLIVGETATVESVKATLQDGRTSINLVTLAGDVTYSSDDVTIATVSDTGVITAKKAGTVKITVKSGTATKDVTLTVLPSSTVRTATAATFDASSVKVVNEQSKTTYVTIKDQLGDTLYADSDAVADLIVENATANGKVIATGELSVDSAKNGSVALEVTADDTNVGTGSISIKSKEGKLLGKVTVNVAAVTGTATRTLVASASSIDLNPTSSADSISFKLEKTLNGYFAGNEEFGDRTVQVFDADGKQLTADATVETDGKTVIVSREDLVVEDGFSNENFETGKGLVKVYDGTTLVATKQFDIVDSAPTISTATFQSGIEFNEANEASLKLPQFLTNLGTSASAFDGVVRYEPVNGNELVVYFDKATTPDGFDLGTDIYLGTVVATTVGDSGDVAFTVGEVATPVGAASTVTVNSAAVDAGDKVQFNVYKRGSETSATSVAKTTVTKK